MDAFLYLAKVDGRMRYHAGLLHLSTLVSPSITSISQTLYVPVRRGCARRLDRELGHGRQRA